MSTIELNNVDDMESVCFISGQLRGPDKISDLFLDHKDIEVNNDNNFKGKIMLNNCLRWYPFDRQIIGLKKDPREYKIRISNLVSDKWSYEGVKQVNGDYFLCLERQHHCLVRLLIHPIFVIMLFVFSVYFIELDPIVNRLTILVTALLAFTAFGSVLTSKIPMMPYSTIVDSYIYICEFNITVITIESVIAYGVNAVVFDIYFGIIFTSCWLIFNFVTYLIFDRNNRRKSWEAVYESNYVLYKLCG